MNVIRQKVSVQFEYAVVFTEAVFDAGNDALAQVITEREPRRVPRVFVVLDAGLLAAWPELTAAIPRWFAERAARLSLAGEPMSIPGGEACKNDPQVIDRLYRAFHSAALDRHSVVLIIGGGAVLDAAGYAAATCHRGLRQVRVPSTVLAQADSGVGVKNGVNAFDTKNFAGTFAPPYAVVADLRLLERLPLRDQRAGQAEAVKIALVRDPELFGWIEANAAALGEGRSPELHALVRRAAELHLRHIATSGDPFEMGSARPLDFGHWAAHKLERLTRHALRHGEAVAIGMRLDSRYCVEAGLLPEAEFARIDAVLARLDLPRWDAMLEDGCLLDGLDEFRQHLGGELTLTLLRGIGRAEEVHAVELERMRATVHWLKTHP